MIILTSMKERVQWITDLSIDKTPNTTRDLLVIIPIMDASFTKDVREYFQQRHSCIKHTSLTRSVIALLNLKLNNYYTGVKCIRVENCVRNPSGYNLTPRTQTKRAELNLKSCDDQIESVCA